MRVPAQPLIMKRTSPSVFIALFPLISAMLSAQTPIPSAPATNGPPTWQIVQVAGVVQIKTNSAASWIGGMTGQILENGGSLRTGPDGKTLLKALDIAGVTIESNATIEVGLLTRTGDTVRAEAKALSGKALFLVNKLKTQDSSFK